MYLQSCSGPKPVYQGSDRPHPSKLIHVPFILWNLLHLSHMEQHTTSLASHGLFFFHHLLYTLVLLLLFSGSVMSNSLWPHGLQHARPPCPSPNPRACSNSWPSCRWCHPTISSSVVPFSSCPRSFPASGSFPVSQLFTSGGQSTWVSASASVLPMNIQDWFPLGWTGWISFQSKGLSRVFSNTTVQKHQFFSAQLSL